MTIPADLAGERRPQVAARATPAGLVDGQHRAERAAADLREALARDPRAGRRTALAADLQQHAGEPFAVHLALLADGERQRPPRPLRGGARPAGIGADLLPYGRLDGALPAERRLAAAVGPRHDPRLVPRRRREVAEHEHAVDRDRHPARAPTPARRRHRRSRRTSRRARASCGGRARRAAAGPGASVSLLGLRHLRAEDPRELEQRGRPRQLGHPGRVQRVAVRQHDDPAARQPGPDPDHGLQVGLAVDRAALRRATATPGARRRGTPRRPGRRARRPRRSRAPAAGTRGRARAASRGSAVCRTPAKDRTHRRPRACAPATGGPRARTPRRTAPAARAGTPLDKYGGRARTP